jgi:CRISPR-associated endonuclease/helicase Cas3
VSEAERFRNWFHQATLHSPYHYQARVALEGAMPGLLHVPTGLGKTAAAILAWLWRRRMHADSAIRNQTPWRLVYCHPMRVLVERVRRSRVCGLGEDVRWTS